jgi:type I restriction enzyme S subunit
MSLPRGWAAARLDDVVVERVPQGTPSTRAVPYIDISAIDRERKRIGETETVTDPTAPTRARQWVKAGDVLVSMTRPNLNAVALVPDSLDGAVASTGFDVLRALGVLPEWLYYRVRSHDFVQDVCKGVQGVVYPAIRPDDVRRHELPVPPRAEQVRIVEALETNLSRLDAAVCSLESAQRKLKVYRTSVLKAAVEGRLVPTEAALARKEGRWYEPADVLIERILKERRRRWEETELAKMKAAGKTPKDDRWKAKYSEPEPPDVDKLPPLPDGWCWAAMPQLGELNRGKSKHRPRNDPRLLGGRHPFVQTGDVRRADTWLRDFTATYSDFGLAQSRLWPAGTLCITIAANIAETAILTFDACFPDSVVGFVASEPVLVRYIEMFLRTAKQDLARYAPATAQKNINLETLEGVVVPLPPLAEQGRMIEELDRILSIGNVVEESIAKQTLHSGRLRQAILSTAFEGKLVDQDPADEPADVLLDRIRAERAATVCALPKAKRFRKLKAAS